MKLDGDNHKVITVLIRLVPEPIGAELNHSFLYNIKACYTVLYLTLDHDGMQINKYTKQLESNQHFHGQMVCGADECLTTFIRSHCTSYTHDARSRT